MVDKNLHKVYLVASRFWRSRSTCHKGSQGIAGTIAAITDEIRGLEVTFPALIIIGRVVPILKD